MRERENPLAHGDARKDSVTEMRRGVVHPPRGARWADAPAFAGQAHENVVTAGVAVNARESVSEDAAAPVVSKLPLDEPGKSAAIVAERARIGEQGREVRLPGEGAPGTCVGCEERIDSPRSSMTPNRPSRNTSSSFRTIRIHTIRTPSC